ncbi:MAG: hypothetical protein ACRD6W_13875 [Nitrososphaerales archaeon]
MLDVLAAEEVDVKTDVEVVEDVVVFDDGEERMTAARTITTIATKTAAKTGVETPLLCIFIEKTICSILHNAIYPLGGEKRGA